MQVRVEVEIFLHAEVFIQAEALRHIADAILHRLRVGCDIDAQYFDSSFVGLHQPGDHSQHRRFAGAIGTHQRRQRTAGTSIETSATA